MCCHQDSSVCRSHTNAAKLANGHPRKGETRNATTSVDRCYSRVSNGAGEANILAPVGCSLCFLIPPPPSVYDNTFKINGRGRGGAANELQQRRRFRARLQLRKVSAVQAVFRFSSRADLLITGVPLKRDDGGV